MKTVFIEATNGPQNWGKFMVARFDDEWKRTSEVLAKEIVPAYERAMDRLGLDDIELLRSIPLLRGVGWGRTDIIVFDLQTCEGAAFQPHDGHGNAAADLQKHSIWVCPLFEPFLVWLYTQDLSDLDKLPKHIDLPDAEFACYGYRRRGKKGE